MIVTFSNSYLLKLYSGEGVPGKPKYSQNIVEQFVETVDILKNAENSHQLRQFRSLNFEALKGDKEGLYSVRVNRQYRIEFRLEKDEIRLVEIVEIEALSKHYEKT